ncbi:MAG: response regulator transcription factor [Candidatus Pacebacteria bacterium]|jgi:two-component system copper resistance phosphate regulon response regulator CusR|nr:response regulator transcription factor [Candidatus Paceibacterota bacterium]
MRILIIEDDTDTLESLTKGLREKGFSVDGTENGEHGSYLARTNDYDLVILDYGLPKKNGFVVCQDIRVQEHESRKHVPIVMLSITGDVPYKIEGLSHGADDYITKPFFFEEVLARIQAILRRPRIRESARMSIDNLIIDSDRQEVIRGKESIYLTRKEFALLEFLARNSGRVVSRSAIAEHVWDINADPFSNTIETHILNLRKKIDRNTKRKLIHSVPGRGYKIDLKR